MAGAKGVSPPSKGRGRPSTNKQEVKRIISSTDVALPASREKKMGDVKTTKLDTSNFRFEVEEKKQEEVYCSCCGESKEQKEFYRSFSMSTANRGVTNVCKNCFSVIWNSYLSRYSNDEQRALYYFCMLMDFSYFRDILEEVKLTKSSVELMDAYIKKIISIAAINGAGTFLDGQTVWDGSTERGYDIFASDSEEELFKPTAEDVKKWGKIDSKDIFFLKNEYRDWSDRHDVSQKSMEEVVKQICFKQLKIHRLNESGQNTSKDLKDFQELLSSANLKPIQNKGLTGEENTFGNWIKRFENERPIPEPDPEFADVDGIWKKVRVWFLGHMCKVLNYETEYSHEYEQEASKYRVHLKEDFETPKARNMLGKEIFIQDDKRKRDS
jgi:hypothetical protein